MLPLAMQAAEGSALAPNQKTNIMETTHHTKTEDLILAFLAKRPGLDPRNYCTPRDGGEGYRIYRREAAEIARDKQDALALLNWARLACTEAQLRAVFSDASDRLCIIGNALEYYAGQYWPTEYRAAVCRKLASLFWHAVPYADGHRDTVRKKAVRYFGKGVASRWFN